MIWWHLTGWVTVVTRDGTGRDKEEEVEENGWVSG